MTRIRSDNIQFGGSFVVPIEESPHNKKIQEALEKEKEIIELGEQKAREIVEQAEQQALEIIEQAKQQALLEVDSIKEAAHKEGFEAGHQEGFEKITEEMQNQVLTVNDFAKSQFDIKQNIVKSASLDIITLVINIAEKICTKAVELNQDVLKNITENAINSLKEKENITITVNPKMASAIYEISEELKEKIPQLSSIKIVEDSSVSADGTIVESPLSRVDSRVKSQINEISEKMFIKLNSEKPEDTEQN